MGFGDFLRRKDEDGDDAQYEELDDDSYYVLSKEGVKKILSWSRFHAQLCEMIHDSDVENCDDEEHKIALLMVFALHPWLLYYGLMDEIEIGEDGDDEEE